MSLCSTDIFTARIRRIWEGNIFSLFTLARGGVPHLRSEVGGYPISGPGRGVPHLRFGGYPISGGVPHVWGDTPSQGGPMSGGYPMSGGDPISGPTPHCTEQHSEHLLRGGRCASCVHAGGLSCYFINR